MARVPEPLVETAAAQPRCVPEILCTPPKLDPRYRRAYTGLSGKDFEAMPVGGWGYIAGVWDSFIYSYYFEKDEEYNQKPSSGTDNNDQSRHADQRYGRSGRDTAKHS